MSLFPFSSGPSAEQPARKPARLWTAMADGAKTTVTRGAVLEELEAAVQGSKDLVERLGLDTDICAQLVLLRQQTSPDAVLRILRTCSSANRKAEDSGNWCDCNKYVQTAITQVPLSGQSLRNRASTECAGDQPAADDGQGGSRGAGGG